MAVTNGTNITAIEKPEVGVDAGPGWATSINNSLDGIEGHDHTTNKGSRITPAAININADLEMNSNDLTEIRTLSMDSTSDTTTADTRAIYVSGSNNLHYRNGSGQDVQITDGTSVVGAAGTITGMGSDAGNQAGASYTDGSKAFNFFTDSGNTDFGKMNHSDLNLYKFSDDNIADTDFVTLQCSSAVSGAGGTITVPGETGTLLTTATSFAGAINIDATGGSGSITLDASAAVSIEADTTITLDAATSVSIEADTTITLDAATSVSIEADTTITLDAETDINLDSNSGIVYFKDNGTAIGKITHSSFDLMIENEVDGKDIIFRQYDGNEVVRMADDRRLYFFDKGGEYIVGDGTDLTVASGADINLTATTDINVPSDVGLTFGNDGEKIEGNGTKLDIAASELDFSIEAGGDINIGANIGLTFGADSQKIEGNGSDLAISSGAELNLNTGSGAGNDLKVNSTSMVVEGDTGAVGMGLTPTDGNVRLTLKAKAKGEPILLTHADDSTEKLHSLYNDGFGNGTFGVYDNADAIKIWLNSAGDSYFMGGQVGIGESVPTHLLHLKGSDPRIYMEDTGDSSNTYKSKFGQVDNNFKISVNNGATDAISIDSSGSITTPSGVFNGTIGTSSISDQLTFDTWRLTGTISNVDGKGPTDNWERDDTQSTIAIGSGLTFVTNPGSDTGQYWYFPQTGYYYIQLVFSFKATTTTSMNGSYAQIMLKFGQGSGYVDRGITTAYFDVVDHGGTLVTGALVKVISSGSSGNSFNVSWSSNSSTAAFFGDSSYNQSFLTCQRVGAV